MKQVGINPEGQGIIHDFQYGRLTFCYQLLFEARSNLAITVLPDRSVLVKAPHASSMQDIQKKLLKRGRWIQNQIKYFDQFHPLTPERENVSGETHYYLGRQYRLRVRREKDDAVKLIGKFFIASTLHPHDRGHVKLLM